MDDSFLIDEPDDVDPKPPRVLWRIVRGVVAATVIVSLLYLFVGRQYFLLRTTPSDVEQQVVESMLDAEIRSLPLTVFLIRVSDGNGSQRTREDAERLVENAARIWEQANIQLRINTVIEYSVREEDLALFAHDPVAFIESVESVDPYTINVFLMRSLGGINGLAFEGVHSVAVADYTSVHDFRTLAHEIGHVLGLDHVPGDRRRLMFRGANGVNMSPDEIVRARVRVQNFQALQCVV